MLRAGAAACAVCCAAPLLTVLGVAGSAATLVTFALAGVVFGIAVSVSVLFAVWARRRQTMRRACSTEIGPVGVDLVISRGGHDA